MKTNIKEAETAKNIEMMARILEINKTVVARFIKKNPDFFVGLNLKDVLKRRK